MTDKEIESLIQKHIKRMKGKVDYQVLLDNIAVELPKESWEDMPGYSEKKANLLYDGDYWKIARWLINAIQEDICDECGEKLNGSFELHHHSRGGDYFDLQIDKLKATHHNCHKTIHRVNVKTIFKELVAKSKKKENERVDNIMSKNSSLLVIVSKMVHRNQDFKNLFDSKYNEKYAFYDKHEDTLMHDWLVEELNRKGISFDVVSNPASQMADIRNKLAKIGLKPIPDRTGHGYLRREFPNRKKTKNKSQTTVIGDTTVTSELQPDPTPSTSSETYTKEELVTILKLQKAGLLCTLQKDSLV